MPSAIDFSTPDGEMLARLTRDTWQFAAAKNYQQMRDFTLALVDENGRARTFSEFKTAAEAINAKYNKSWLLAEYNSAIGASAMAARWSDFKSTARLMPYLKYQTVGDDRVRNEHQALDGVTRKIDDAFWSTHYPPNGWGCRCDVIQLPGKKERETTEIPKVAINPLFATNLAATGLIYPAGHPYYNGIPAGELKKALSWLPADATYKRYKVGNGTVEINLLHYGKSKDSIETLKQHVDICNNLIDLGFKNIKLLPEIHQNDAAIKDRFYPKGYKASVKNPDCWMQTVNGHNIVCDFKVMQGTGRNFSGLLSKSAKQASYSVIKLSAKNTLSKRRIEGKVKAAIDANKSLKGVIILNADGTLLGEIYRTK